MLKFKLTSGRIGTDVKALVVNNVERLDGQSSDVPLEYSIYDDRARNDVRFKFNVSNLYNIQSGSHLRSITEVMIDNDDVNNIQSFKKVSYEQEIVVDSVSKPESGLVFSIPKEILLPIKNMYIETRYNLIKYKNNGWEISLSDKAFIDSVLPEIDGVTFKESKTFCVKDGDAYIDENDQINIYRNGEFETPYDRCSFVDINSVPYGEERQKTFDNYGNIVVNNSVFYYENEIWKSIGLFGENLEGCLINGEISFKSFHEYDDKSRKAIKMKNDRLYFTREDYIIIEFNNTHYFGQPNEVKKIDEGYAVRNITTKYGREIIESIDYPKVYVYFGKDSLDGETMVKTECHIDTSNRLSFNYNTFNTNGKIVVQNSEWESGDNSLPINKIIVTEEELGEKIKTFEETLFPYGIVFNENGDIPFQSCFNNDIIINRDNFYYDGIYGTFSLLYDTTVNTIQIPITQKFENDLHHNDMLNTHFVEKQKSEMINKIIDMEKDVYMPAIHKEYRPNDKGETPQINAEYQDCYKIIFNLHFRKHRDTQNMFGQTEEWSCDRNCYWNGTRVLETSKGKVVDLMGRIYNYPLSSADKTEQNKLDYFSYYGNEPNESGSYDGVEDYDVSKSSYRDNRKNRNTLKEYQSDLLSYLGFTNDDVKYQKSKLKKSFLRISFYDSDNIANQNLLHTSTIFVDSGDIFAKYIKNIETEDEYKRGSDIYTRFEYDRLSKEDKKSCTINGQAMAKTGSSMVENDEFTTYNVNGLKVDREPMRNNGISNIGDNFDKLEDMRMSSQIVVTDKYSSKRSSEGFYFYTYKTSDGGVFPSEIYMRVEFNHAGYGRTIPFMMPYIRKAEENNHRYSERKTNKLKTFDDICYDWSEYDYEGNNPKEESDIGYGTVRYMKYCHIKWKYRYDKKTQKHIYYLDPDLYGDSVTSKNGHGHNIILNLYEGKIR